MKENGCLSGTMFVKQWIKPAWLKPAMSPATERYPIIVRRASSLCMFAEWCSPGATSDYSHYIWQQDNLRPC